jgi:2-C-methyl-D-erythritol 4-phosphate cytidylyltransferase / 2-C-methyl-D-erythritol 2,4-cyclodiphosphate synthase
VSGGVGAEAPADAASTSALSESATAADVIVVAAGASTRMGGLDKLTALVADRPLLAWTLAAVAAAASTRRIVVVAAEDRVAELRAAAWLPPAVIDVVAGGRRRQDSVAAGFRALDSAAVRGSDEDAPVLVHDGARPLVSAALVDAVARATARHGAAIPVVPVTDTLKRLDGELIDGTVDRTSLAAAQTPQGIRRGIFRQMLTAAEAGEREATDEAAMVEAIGLPVHVVAGDPANLKVTIPADLERVDAALRRTARRTGFATDRHAFGPGSPLRLGGLEIAGAPRLHGHSDGDAVLHAIASAMLSAAGRGDLGRLFPADARTPRGVESSTLVAEARRVIEAAGWHVAAVSVAIEAARPRLGGHLEPMTAAIAGLLGLDHSAVGVSASTGNLSSAEGAGRSVAATALVTLAGVGAA